jgi:hypothetical protein
MSGGAVLGECESKKVAKLWGHTFIAINPNALVDDFDGKAASIIATVEASGDGIRIPGERSAETAEERKAAGVMLMLYNFYSYGRVVKYFKCLPNEHVWIAARSAMFSAQLATSRNERLPSSSNIDGGGLLVSSCSGVYV